MSKSTTKIIIIAVIVIVIVCVGVSILGVQKIQQRSEENAAEEERVLNEISERIGVEPDWLAVREYVYCDVLKPGTPREEVDRRLSQVGSWHSNIGNTLVSFEERFTYNTLCPLSLRYDENDRLVNVNTGERNIGPKAWCEQISFYERERYQENDDL